MVWLTVGGSHAQRFNSQGGGLLVSTTTCAVTLSLVNITASGNVIWGTTSDARAVQDVVTVV